MTRAARGDVAAGGVSQAAERRGERSADREPDRLFIQRPDERPCLLGLAVRVEDDGGRAPVRMLRRSERDQAGGPVLVDEAHGPRRDARARSANLASEASALRTDHLADRVYCGLVEPSDLPRVER